MKFGLVDSVIPSNSQSFSILNSIDGDELFGATLSSTLYHLSSLKFDLNKDVGLEPKQPAASQHHQNNLNINPLAHSRGDVDIEELKKFTDDWLSARSRKVQRIIAAEKDRLRLDAERIAEENRLRQARLEEERLRKQKQEELRAKQEQDRVQKLKEESLRQQELAKKRQQQEQEQAKKEKEAAAAAAAEKLAIAKAEELKSKKEAELKAKQAAGNSNPAAAKDEFLKYTRDIADIKANIVEKMKTSPLKSTVSATRRKINAKLGQLSKSMRQAEVVLNGVSDLILPCKQDQLAFNSILNSLAKNIVAQAESEVVVQPSRGQSLALFANMVMARFPEFEYFMAARLVKKCPYIIGYSVPTDDEEGRKQMGWKKSGSDWEDRPKFNERVAGICTVWALMASHPQTESTTIFSLRSTWTFLARNINTHPDTLSSTHYTVTANWWEAAANSFFPQYRNQSLKLLQCLVQDWTVLGAERKYPDTIRLRLLGEDWMNLGTIKSFGPMER